MMLTELYDGKLVGCFFFRIPGAVLACHPLVHAALSSLNCDPLSDASVNGIARWKAHIYYFWITIYS